MFVRYIEYEMHIPLTMTKKLSTIVICTFRSSNFFFLSYKYEIFASIIIGYNYLRSGE